LAVPVAGRPLPRSRLLHDPIVEWGREAYEPAPLDILSARNGLLKIVHPCVAKVQIEETLEVIHWLRLMYGPYMNVPLWSEEEAIEALDPDKASGPPFSYIYGVTKGDVLEHLGYPELLKEFSEFDSYSECTLKDELRIKGKDSRLFVPAPIQVIAVGNRLFGAQNDAIAQQHNRLPIKIGLSTPGGEMCNLWAKMLRHDGMKFDSDGAQSDAHFSIWMAMVCRDFRKSYIPKEMHALVDRYYSTVYNGWIAVTGVAYKVIMNASGQTNTASDNSLGYLAAVMLHAIRGGLTYRQFTENLLINILGDDMLWSTKIDLFRPLALEKTFNDLGMYLESPSNEPMNFYDLQFMGVHPMVRSVNGSKYLLYTGRTDKFTTALNYTKRGSSNDKRLDKLVALAQNCFADEELFGKMREVAYKFAREWGCENATLASLEDLTMLHLYTGLQSRILEHKGFTMDAAQAGTKVFPLTLLGNATSGISTMLNSYTLAGTLHSFGGFIFSPAGHGCKKPLKICSEQFSRMLRIGGRMFKAVGGGKGFKAKAKRGFQGYQKIRKNRMTQGRRVFAPATSGYNRGWIKRKGGNGNRSGALQMTGKQIPTQSLQAVRGVQPQSGPIRRSDVAGTEVLIQSSGPFVQDIPFFPGNEMDFPSTSILASQFEYGAFDAIRILYIPNTSSTQDGTLYYGVLPNPETISNINTSSDIAGLKKNAMTDVKQAHMLEISRSDLNTVYKKWPFKKLSETDTSNPMYCQGRLVFMVDNFDIDTNFPNTDHTIKTLGTFKISYVFYPIDPVKNVNVNETVHLTMTGMTTSSSFETKWNDPSVVSSPHHSNFVTVQEDGSFVNFVFNTHKVVYMYMKCTPTGGATTVNQTLTPGDTDKHYPTLGWLIDTGIDGVSSARHFFVALKPMRRSCAARLFSWKPGAGTFSYEFTFVTGSKLADGSRITEYAPDVPSFVEDEQPSPNKTVKGGTYVELGFMDDEDRPRKAKK